MCYDTFGCRRFWTRTVRYVNVGELTDLNHSASFAANNNEFTGEINDIKCPRIPQNNLVERQYLCESSNSLSELGFHLRQRLSLADGLLQLLLSQLQLLLELAVFVFTLEETH